MKAFIAGAVAIFCSAVVCFGQTPGLNAKQEAEHKDMVTRFNKAVVHYQEVWEATKNERGYPRKDLSDTERYALLTAAVRLELVAKEGEKWLTWYSSRHGKKPADIKP